MNKLQHPAPALPALALLLLLVGGALTLPAAAQEQLATLAGDGSIILRSPTGETLVSINPERALIPASLLKIPLAQVALTSLGADFRFETHFYRNDSGDLLIRGLGDPLLVSEEIARIADMLAARGLQQVRRLVLDDSAFESNPELPLEENSSQPYAARNSALAVNFNTVNLAWTATGALISGESQTPLTALARALGAQHAPVALAAGEPQRLRINLGDDPVAGLRQAQQLFLLLLEESGITVTDAEFQQAAVTDEWTLFYQHFSSRSLRDILTDMLRYSNNFIANQLFLTLGAHSSGYPATVANARAHLQQQLAVIYGGQFGSDPQLLLMLEGSGLSPAQRSSGAAMLHILEVFKPYAELLPEVDGVLRKSGTLTGVYNFAGYMRGPDGLYPFVILTNQAVNRRAEILAAISRELNR
ncbi:MAG: peptidase S13 [Xanthomonadales bacterium]|nr:peptidase S13 [Xanthomonadales bacterium]